MTPFGLNGDLKLESKKEIPAELKREHPTIQLLTIRQNCCLQIVKIVVLIGHEPTKRLRGKKRVAKDKEFSALCYDCQPELPAESIVGETEPTTTAWYRSKSFRRARRNLVGIVASADPVL